MQINYAELLLKLGDKKLSSEKAQLVLKYAETQELIDRAQALLNIDSPNKFSVLEQIDGVASCVVLIPIQGADNWLMSELQVGLANTLKIPIYIQSVEMEYPKCARDGLSQYLNFVRNKIKDDHSRDKWMSELSLDDESLENDDTIIRILTHFVQGEEFKAELVKNLDAMRGKDFQWDAEELISVLSAKIEPYKRDKIAYVCVTPKDVFAGDYNFVFGQTLRELSVISYHRFTSEFNDEVPNQARLVKRIKMQALASIGHIYGIKRCSNPTCARAYPHNLAEHDAKNGELCNQCENALTQVFWLINKTLPYWFGETGFEQKNR